MVYLNHLMQLPAQQRPGVTEQYYKTPVMMVGIVAASVNLLTDTPCMP